MVRVVHNKNSSCIGCIKPRCVGLCYACQVKLLVHRGPDHTGDDIIPVSEGKELYLLGTLLQMRGDVTPQPFTKSDNHSAGIIIVILWTMQNLATYPCIFISQRVWVCMNGDVKFY